MSYLQIYQDWNKFDDYLSKATHGLKSYVPEVDNVISEIPGLLVIQGEPKSCKSTVALGVAIENCKEGVACLYWDRENGLQRTRLRMLSYLSQVNPQAIKFNIMPDPERHRVNDAISTLKNLPFYYNMSNNVEEVQENLSKLLQKHSKVLFIVDSLQSLVQELNDRRASVDYWVYLFNELKLQYEGQLTIAVISEKNRYSYGIASKGGAKESGSIEYKAEMVWDIYIRPDEPQTIHMECTYNRDGETGYLTSFFKPNPFSYKLDYRRSLPL